MMITDFKAQIDRAQELYDELEGFYYSDLRNKIISDETRNRVQEILLKNRRVLDQVMQKFFDEKIAPNLTEEDKRKVKVYFPIAKKEDDLKSALGRLKIRNPKTSFPIIYAYLKSILVSNKNYNWLDVLGEKSNEGHKRLTPVVKEGDNYLVLRDIVKIGEKASNITFVNSNIGGVKVESLNIKENAPFTDTPIDDALNPKIEWAKITFEETQIDILEFCRIAIIGVKTIISEFLRLF